MTEETVEQISMFDQDTWFGKTSPEHSVPTKEKTSELCWKKWQGSAKRESLFLDLRRENGRQQESSLETDTVSHGESLMHNIGEYLNGDEGFALPQILMGIQQPKSCLTKLNTSEAPNEEIVTHLSDILEINPDPKYNLSAKACQGILNRANKRGKVLPPILQEALEQMIARYKWKDGKVPSLRAYPSDNHPAIVLENHPADSRVKIAEDGIVQTLNARMGTGGGNVPMVVVSLDRASYNQGKNAKFDIGISEDGVAHTCIAKGPGGVAYAVDCRNVSVNEDTNWTLQAKESGGTSYNLNNVVITTRPRYIVRRLTPLECERLQGYPDGWTDIGEYTDSKGKKRKSSDAARYKALGNSIALPSWKWVLKRICAYYERDATMASLFDGISGFTFLWTQINGMGSVLWTSEIEDFPIAVCKKHFGDDETGEVGDFYEAILGRNKKENG